MDADFFKQGIVLLDGAMGTVLQQRGLPPGGKPELLNFTDPELLRSIYREYIAAGSQILCANTFGASTPKLAGTGRTVDEVVSAAVAIAREAAAGTDVKVSLDVGPLGELLEPMGSLTFEGAYGYFQEIALAGERAGADLVSIETMTDLYEAKAALLAVKENTRLPVFVTMSFEADGRTFTGCTLSSMARTLEGLGADAIGLNCSLGPDKLAPFLAELCACTRLPVIAKPNAGLPDPVTGRYGMGPEEFAAALLPCLEAGVTIFGGCCGTTPAHIKTMADALKETDLLPVKTARRRFLASERSHMEIRLDGPFAIIGERINPTGKKKLQEKLREGSLDLACEMAQQQEQDGAAVLDINMGLNGIDEKEMMRNAVYEVSSVTDLPLCIDSSHVDIIEEALRIYPGRALINSISLEQEKFENLLPIAAKYGAMFILLPLSDAGLPENKAEKRRIIETIVSAALKSGMAKEDIIVDGLVATVGANPNAAVECLETIAYCRKHDLATVCGLSNISFGLPERSCINTAFLTAAITRGLTMAIANPAQKALVDAAYAADLLMNKPGADLRYIRRANRLKGEASFGPGDIPRTPGSSGAPVSPRQRVFDCVVEGGKGRILEEVKLALKDGEDPKGLIDGCLIPAINRVGELFEQQAYFLPQLISSAGAMQNAIAYLEPMIKREAGKEDTAVIIMATVEGDIHDIGKNLVVLMLRNYGYRVIDLGKDVTAERIVEAAIREHAAIIGLSALMTTTMMRMKDVVELAAKKNCGSRIIIGGAAVTESFAEEIGAHGYSKDAAECVRLVERLLKNTPDSQ